MNEANLTASVALLPQCFEGVLPTLLRIEVGVGYESSEPVVEAIIAKNFFISMLSPVGTLI